MMAVQNQQQKEQPASGGGGFSARRRRSERLLRRMMTSNDDTSSSLSSSLNETKAVIPSTRRALPTSKKRRKNASHDEDKKKKENSSTSNTVKPKKAKVKKEATDASSCSKTLEKVAHGEKTEIFKDCLPRTREKELLLIHSPTNLQVIGIDEAGRGPLAGPVVAAAAIIPTDIPGVMDSKKLTKEEDREELYEKIISSPNARWCIAIGDAGRIDEINILQATLECMRNATMGVLNVPEVNSSDSIGRREMEASSKYSGCYIVCGINDEHGNPIDLNDNVERVRQITFGKYYALIDGNRCPKDMPCESESMVKGDSREYAIAAASILAKVTRDRLMHEYDVMYPQYELKRHKGYPTSAHMASVRKFGASPIHRRTFAPLKHMSFDEEGRIIVKEGEPET